MKKMFAILLVLMLMFTSAVALADGTETSKPLLSLVTSLAIPLRIFERICVLARLNSSMVSVMPVSSVMLSPTWQSVTCQKATQLQLASSQGRRAWAE